MSRSTKIVAAALAVLFSTSIAFSADPNKITAEGSTTVLPVAQKTAELLMDSNPSLDIAVRGGGSGVGINSLTKGGCDIAMASRAMKDSEKQEALKNKINPVEHIIAMDAIALIVNPKNGVSSLTKDQIKDIFTGKITNWKEVGGADKKIVIVSRDSASGTFETFNELVLKGEKVSSSALMQASNQAVSGIVDRSDGAIGYVGLGYVTSKTKALKIDGISPSIETVLNKQYAFSRALFFYTNGVPKGAAKAYIDFILSAQGQKIVKEMGFVPLPVKK